MAVILTGTEYIDLDAVGASLDVRQRPLAFYAEVEFTDTGIMLPFSHGRAAGGAQEWSLFCNISTGQIQGRWENDDPNLFGASNNGGYNDGVLHRALTVVRAATNTLDLYVDGSMVGQNPGIGVNLDTRNTNDLTRIGMDPAGPQFFFVGQISNVALWDVEISDADAQDLTAGTITPGDLLTGTIEWWPLDYDARGAVNELDGTPVGDPDFTEEPPGGETVTLDATLPALTGSFTADASVAVQVTGTLPELQGDFAVATEADAQFAGALPALGADFDITASADVEFAGMFPGLTGSFDIDTTADVQLAGTLPALGGDFDIAATAAIELGGTIPALIGSFDIGTAADVELAGALPALQGSFTIVTPGTVALVGVLPGLIGDFLIGAGVGPPVGPHTLRAVEVDHSLRAIGPGHTLRALEQGVA